MPNEETLPAVLLVSASSLTGKSIDRLLSGQFRIVQVQEASQAWEMLQESAAYSTIVCDLEGSIDNTALLERIRHAQSRTIASLPVLLLVGENIDESQRDHALSLGATDFINMPFSSTELKARVRFHARLFTMHKQETEYNVDEINTSVDMLNNLMHEQHFSTRLEQEVSFSLRHKTFISACLLKIDATDDISDQYGKKVYNGIVRAVAGIIEKKSRREDIYAYLGGATFALIYPVTNGLGANIATRRLLEKVAGTRIRLDGEELPVTMSAGLFSSMLGEEQTAQEIMEILQARLHQARQKGGNQIVSSKTEQEQTEISVEQALNLIADERTAGLEKQVPQLLDTLMPLLEFAREHNEVELEGVIGSLDIT